MSTATTLAPPDVRFLDIPLEQLRQSPLNPRKRMTGLEELTESVRQVGILEPLVARPVGDAFEVIAGGRRLEAARAAGLASVPCSVRALTDEQALELAIIENNQRGDIHPLEEAEAFQRLQALDPGYTPGAIAAKIGRPVAYVVQRLRLLTLTPDAREAFANGDFTIGHAQLLAPLTPEQQQACLGACYEYELDFSGTGEDQRVTAPVRKLREHIRETVALDVTSEDVQAEFPELARASAAAAAEGATVLMLADTWGPRPTDPHAPLPRGCFQEVDELDEGAQRGVFVVGRRRGMVTWVRVIPPPTPQERAPGAPRAKKTPAEREADQAAQERERKQQEAAKAKQARRQQVQIVAVQQLIAKTSEPGSAWGAAQVRVLVESMIGMDCFDRPVIEAAAAALKVPTRVFEYSGTKDRLKLSAPKLAQVMAVLAVGQQAEIGLHDDEGADAFEAFGVDLKAIDKAVAKEQAAKVQPQAPTARSKKAAKKR